MFDLFDSNGGGTIDAEELDLALKSVDIQLSQEDLQEVLSAMDKDGKEYFFANAVEVIIVPPDSPSPSISQCQKCRL